ncbi:MAG: tetratricopeptide repeat protein [Candidatus Omnitrophica bacterium]|nr:tetratricopeptide repeat protein [Candidatus Omnitrophota bacterium]
MSDDKKKIILYKKASLTILCVLISCVAAEAASPKRNVKEGNRYYQNGDYTASREKYVEALKKTPESDIVNYNLGTAFYKEEDYEKAIDHLVKVLLSEDNELKESAYYNLGNALYQSGMLRVVDDVDLAISSLEKSLSQYERAVAIDDGDKDAKHNHDYVQKELILLKERQKQQQKQNQKQCDLPKDKKDQQQQGQKSKEDQKSQEGEQQEQQEGQKGKKQEEQQDKNGEEGQKQPGQDELSQEQQEKQEQERGQEGEEDYNKQQESGAQPLNAQELTQKEAQMLLEKYQQDEQPQGLLNVYLRKGNTRPVLKDW